MNDSGTTEAATAVQGLNPAPDLVDWHRLRAGVLRNPALACTHLRRLIRTNPSGTGTGARARRVDLGILLAEAYQQAQRPGAASDACSEVFQIAQTLDPVDWARQAIALGVSADLALLRGAPDAVDACIDYVAACQQPSPTSAPRLIAAYALYAVAVYQNVDCTQGRRLLEEVRRQHARQAPDGAAVAAALDAAGAVMRDGCRGAWVTRPTGAPPLMAGGVLLAALHTPRVGALAYRVRQARHTCGLTAPASGDPPDPPDPSGSP